eukprot:856206-Amphidinium_carterae.2
MYDLLLSGGVANNLLTTRLPSGPTGGEVLIYMRFALQSIAPKISCELIHIVVLKTGDELIYEIGSEPLSIALEIGGSSPGFTFVDCVSRGSLMPLKCR